MTNFYIQIGRQAPKVSRLGADPTWKATWRFIGRWVCQNHKLYYTYVIGVAWGVYNFWWYTMVGYYRQRNHHRSLEYAIQKEKEWELIKPKDDDEDYYDEEGEESEGGEGEAGDAPTDDAGGDGDAEEDDE